MLYVLKDPEKIDDNNLSFIDFTKIFSSNEQHIQIMGIPSNHVSLKIEDDSFTNYINALTIKFHHKYENEQKIYFIIGG